MRWAIIVSVAAAVAFVCGMQAEAYRVADLIIMRDAKEQCFAYDPHRMKKTDPWPPSRDGRCHLYDYRRLW